MIYLSMELKDLHNWNQVDSNRKGRCMVCLGLRDGWKCGLFCSFFQWHSQVLMGNLAVLLLICVHLLLGSSTTLKAKTVPIIVIQAVEFFQQIPNNEAFDRSV